MEKIKVIKTKINGAKVLEPQVFYDERGYFFESYNQKDLEKIGITKKFVQENQSLSKKGVLRGIHYQKDFPYARLIRVIKGKIFDVAIDVRRESSTFGQWYGVELSEENKREFYIPEGCAHGFYVKSDEAIVIFKVTDFWHPNDEIGISWNDPNFNIEWPIDPNEELIIAEKDQNYSPFKK